MREGDWVRLWQSLEWSTLCVGGQGVLRGKQNEIVSPSICRSYCCFCRTNWTWSTLGYIVFTAVYITSRFSIAMFVCESFRASLLMDDKRWKKKKQSARRVNCCPSASSGHHRRNPNGQINWWAVSFDHPVEPVISLPFLPFLMTLFFFRVVRLLPGPSQGRGGDKWFFPDF